MTYKMKGFSGFKSPLKQDKKVPGSDWNVDDYLVDGKPAKEVVKELRQKERNKWMKSIEDAKKRFGPKPNKESWLSPKKK